MKRYTRIALKFFILFEKRCSSLNNKTTSHIIFESSVYHLVSFISYIYFISRPFLLKIQIKKDVYKQCNYQMVICFPDGGLFAIFSEIQRSED